MAVVSVDVEKGRLIRSLIELDGLRLKVDGEVKLEVDDADAGRCVLPGWIEC